MSIDINVKEGGFGSEALILREYCNIYPGIGGEIKTEQSITVARRLEFNQTDNIGHKLFLRHSIIKKLDDYFVRKGNYNQPHIPRPLGSFDKGDGYCYIDPNNRKEYREGYIYQWSHGSDYFPSTLFLEEEGAFIGSFNKIGINLGYDLVDVDSNAIKNIIHLDYHEYSNFYNDIERLSKMWKRIDFGDRSIVVNYDEVEKYLKEDKADLKHFLGDDRYNLMFLALNYLKRKDFSDKEKKMLETLARKYRESTLSHLKLIS